VRIARFALLVFFNAILFFLPVHLSRGFDAPSSILFAAASGPARFRQGLIFFVPYYAFAAFAAAFITVFFMRFSPAQ
jgi:hypothetical protein